MAYKRPGKLMQQGSMTPVETATMEIIRGMLPQGYTLRHLRIDGSNTHGLIFYEREIGQVFICDNKLCCWCKGDASEVELCDPECFAKILECMI